NNQLLLTRYFFHYRARLAASEGAALLTSLSSAAERFEALGNQTRLTQKRSNGHITAELSFGNAEASDLDRVSRLKLRRPRKLIPVPQLPEPAEHILAGELFPADLYVGSGISYEAGLPTLCDMHDIFGVDCHDQGGFMTGAKDWLPRALADEGLERVRKFCLVHSMALTAEATPAMKALAAGVRSGAIGKVFTDNVDNLLSKTGVTFERVRGSGVFNERYPATFTAPNLIVIGVAADRRQIVRQARAAGKTIIIVNPCAKVSPNVTHLDYVRPTDPFFRCTAAEFFERVGPL
ncbi:MAG: hypothetical protein AAGF86_11485, partial [Pseudomonadota bacterium]